MVAGLKAQVENNALCVAKLTATLDGPSELSLDNLLYVLRSDMSVIKETIKSIDFSRINKQQAQDVRERVEEALTSLQKLEGCLSDLCEFESCD